jgi:chromosome segregation ATPase
MSTQADSDSEAALTALESRIENLLEARKKLLHDLAELDVSLTEAQVEHDRLTGRVTSRDVINTNITPLIDSERLEAIRQEAQRPPPPDPPTEIIVARVVRTWRSIYTYPPRLWEKIIGNLQNRARSEIQRRNWDKEGDEPPDHA